MKEPEPEESLSEPELRARIAAGSRHATDHLALADLLKENSRFEEAAQVYEQGLAVELSDVEKARLAWELSAMLDRMGRGREAVSAARKVLRLLVQEADSADVLLLRGMSHKAIALALLLDDAGAAAQAARSAVESLERLVRDYGVSDATVGVYLELAWLYSWSDADKAIECCEAYLRQDDLTARERAQGFLTLAEALRRAERLPEAEDRARRALNCQGGDAVPGQPLMYQTLGRIQRDANKPAEARRSLENALSALRRLPYGNQDIERDVYWDLAELQHGTGDFPEAVSVLTKLVQDHPEDARRQRALLWRGQCYANLGLREQARQDYQEVLNSSVASEEERAAAREGLAELPLGRP